MVLKQCVACNAVVSNVYRACSCGHVLQDMKLIGGKRFSGYRARLYDRLETERLKALTNPVLRYRSLGTSDEENKPDAKREVTPVMLSTMVTLRPTNPHMKHTNQKHRRKRRRKGFRGLPTSSNSRGSKPHPIPVELVSRFPSALSEINKRIMQQNMLWASLTKENA